MHTVRKSWAIANNHGVSLTRKSFLPIYRERYKPLLDGRSDSFEIVFEHIERLHKGNFHLIETGCVRRMHDWSAGQSTLLFDQFLQVHSGTLWSVDISAHNCAHARTRCSSHVLIHCRDSIEFLKGHVQTNGADIDLLYLDSFDVDWSHLEPSARHHLAELEAAWPRLRKGALLWLTTTKISKAKLVNLYLLHDSCMKPEQFSSLTACRRDGSYSVDLMSAANHVLDTQSSMMREEHSACVTRYISCCSA